MENKGLLFIPDISGFTKFVNQTDIDHSRMIVQELLEVLINSNQFGLEVSEIEGDAILFYKYGELPELADLYKQVKRMFIQFHKQLLTYDYLKYCKCNACISAKNLSLKVITHYGEFTGYNIKQFKKLIGKDVIIAHQLLKNDIEQHEYWLVTKSLLKDDQPVDFAEWMKWKSSTKQTENGEIQYLYTQLTQLKQEVKPDLPELELSDKTKIFSFSREYDTDIITLFHAAGDFNYRSRWLEGVKLVEVTDSHLPRVGMRYRCVMDDEEDTLYTSSYSNTGDRVQFSEIDEKKNSSTYFTLEKINDYRTRLTIDFYLKKSIIIQLVFSLLKKKRMEEIFRKSMVNIEGVIKQIKLSA